jgi:putative oxidoreductase
MSDATGLIVLLGRVIFAYFFGAVAGVAHIRGSQGMEGYAKGSGFPLPPIAGWPVGVWLIAGAVSLALGFWPDIGALMIAAFLLTAALFFHRYWEVEDPGQKMTQTFAFWRNLLGIGGCAVMFGTFVALGPALRFSMTSALFDF